MRFAVTWWILTAMLSLIALSYVLRIFRMAWAAHKGACDPFAPDEPLLVMLFMEFLMIIAWVYAPIEIRPSLMPQIHYCISLWFFLLVCVIIQSKIAERVTWGEYMRRRLHDFLDFLTYLRAVFLKIEEIKNKLSPRIRAVIVLGFATILVLGGAHLQSGEASEGIFLFVFAILFLICAASFSLHSCGRLLFFWMVYSLIFSMLVINVLQPHINGLSGYLIFVVAYSALWLLLAGTADEAPVKMGCEIINTITTVLLIVTQVFSGWGAQHLPPPESLPGFWDAVQHYSAVILLPLVAAGYLSALLKSVQVYCNTSKG